MKKVQEIRRSGTETLDAARIDTMNGGENFGFGIAAGTCIKKVREPYLILPILVDIRDSQFRLPQEGVVSSLEELTLFCDRANDRLER